MFHLNDYVSSERIDVSGVPCLHFKPHKAKNDFKTMFLYHGWMSRKENLSLLANLLCLSGYHVISPDAYMHGERGAELDYSPQVRHRYFWDVVFRTVEEAKEMIAEAIDKGLALPGKIIAAGDSMGGTIATGIFTHHSGISALINVNGCASWEFLEQRTRRVEHKESHSEDELLNIRCLDPANNVSLMYPRPMLLLHGTSDTILPIECQEDFVKKADQIYIDRPDLLQFVKVPRMNHFISMGMMETLISWLNDQS